MRYNQFRLSLTTPKVTGVICPLKLKGRSLLEILRNTDFQKQLCGFSMITREKKIIRDRPEPKHTRSL